MASYDPFVIGLLVALLLLVFFLYLMLRRTVSGFREGMEQGKNR